MVFDSAIAEIIPFMKRMGYRKNRNNFVKRTNEVALAVSFQKSVYGCVWFLYFGATALSILDVNSFSAPNYPVVYRFEGLSLNRDQIEYAVRLWEEKYGTFEKLVISAVENKLPRTSNASFVGELCSQAWRYM